MNSQSNKDIFDEMENTNEINSEQIEVEIDSIRNTLFDNKPFRVFLIVLSIFFFVLSLYNLYLNFSKTEDINYNYLIINNSIIVGISLFMLLTSIFKNKLESIFKTLLAISLIIFVGFNILVNNNVLKIEKQKLMPNLVGMTYQDVKNWADENSIIIEPNYEYSDIYDEYIIINQNISTETLLKTIKKISIVISSGPSYDKTVVISNMNGWNIDDALIEVNKNLLNNVEIEYVKSNDYDKDIIINQSKKGNMRRNDKLVLTVSLGNTLEEIEMIDIKDKTLFDLELWLKRNGINYTKQYVYSDDVKRNSVISVSTRQGEKINIENDKLVVLISKGKAIIVPNILEMGIDEVTKWIIDNNLKIDYEDKYDSSVPLGGILDCNYKENDEIEEETIIKVVTSKGPLKMESFATLNDFRSWAEKYKIKYREEYQYNDSVSKGKIIKFSIKTGDIIPNNETITVYISNGKAITIPNFVNKTKTEASKLCNNLGLKCSYTYGSYSSTAKDTVTSQSKKSGLTVISGTSINLTLSKGPAKNCTIYIQSEWFGKSFDATKSSLQNELSTRLKKAGCSNISFDYVKNCYNTGGEGMISANSPTKGGNNTFTEGKKYTIYINDSSSSCKK